MKRTSFRKPATADITTGKAALDAEEDRWPELTPKNFIERVWFWVV